MKNIKFELFTKYTKEPLLKIYNHKIKSLLELEEIFILCNISGDILVFPVKETNWGVVQAFETVEIANQYIKENKLEGYAKISMLSINSFMLMLDKLFFKGITGILYNCDLSGLKTIYIPLTKLFKDVEDTFVKEECQPIIKSLLNALYNNDYLHYIHHPTLNAEEISMGIVRYVIRFDGKNNYIDLFNSRELAEDYCKKKGIEKRLEDNLKRIVKDKEEDKNVLQAIGDDALKEKYPVTTIINNILFHSIKILLDKEKSEKDEILKKIEDKKENGEKLTKADKKDLILANNSKSNLNVKLHTIERTYTVNMSDFLQLIINTGFEQLDLS